MTFKDFLEKYDISDRAFSRHLNKHFARELMELRQRNPENWKISHMAIKAYRTGKVTPKGAMLKIIAEATEGHVLLEDWFPWAKVYKLKQKEDENAQENGE